MTMTITMDDITALCKRRGFLFPAATPYGGLQGMYDYGPMGVELKKNLVASWWQAVVHAHTNIYGLDSSIITHAQTLHYSGHTETFNDMLVDCKHCQARHRHDHLTNPNQCPNCKSEQLTAPRAFNLMMKTHLGPVQDADSAAYLRPETAQGIFSNFKNVVDCFSPKLPFGIAQVGKAFRNEITPRNFIFRVREFEQMELEFFVPPGEDETWHQYWVDARYNWWLDQGLSAEKLSKDAQPQHELAHYAKATTDITYRFAHGQEELEGIANRTDFDLGSHSKNQDQLNLHATVKTNTHSTQKMTIRHNNQETVPFVIEPSAGLDRGVLAVLTEAYYRDNTGDTERIVLKLKPHLAPIKAAVIPLAKNKPELVALAQNIQRDLQHALKCPIALENSGNIGKNYRRHDEIGTPLCITIDFETLASTAKDPNSVGTVTVRDRDTLHQTRVAIKQLPTYIRNHYAL